MIPEAVRLLILERIDSVSEMEALLLMHGHPASAYTAQELAERLYISAEDAGRLLTSLLRRSLCQPEDADRVRYGPATPELEVAVDALAEAYKTRLIPLTKLIHSKAAPSVQHFADAFRLRKET